LHYPTIELNERFELVYVDDLTALLGLLHLSHKVRRQLSVEELAQLFHR
jgi:hypothetical protein